MSFAKNWWPDLQRLLYQLEKLGGNAKKAKAFKNKGRNKISNATRKYPLFVNDFFMKRVNLSMKTVMKNALQIELYWGCVEFAPGRGDIHLHVVAIAKDRAYLQDFFKASTLEEKAKVFNNHATEKKRLDHRVQKPRRKTLPEQYFYCVFIDSTFKKQGKANTHTDQHQILMPEGMNCKPCYPVDSDYARGMLIMHKPWNKNNTLDKLLKKKQKTINKFL